MEEFATREEMKQEAIRRLKLIKPIEVGFIDKCECPLLYPNSIDLFEKENKIPIIYKYIEHYKDGSVKKAIANDIFSNKIIDYYKNDILKFISQYEKQNDCLVYLIYMNYEHINGLHLRGYVVYKEKNPNFKGHIQEEYVEILDEKIQHYNNWGKTDFDGYVSDFTINEIEMWNYIND